MGTNIIRNAEVRSQNVEVQTRSAELGIENSKLFFCDSYHRFEDNEQLNIIGDDLSSYRPEDANERFRTWHFSLVPFDATIGEARIVARQLLGAGTSVGANSRAACRARSRAEFVAELGIVLEESDEAVFWLELLTEAGIIHPNTVEPLMKEANELTSIFVTSLCTAKNSSS